MKRAASGLIVATTILLAASPSEAAQHVYPAKGQSAAAQAKDEAACSSWATSQSGYDPAKPPQVADAKPAPVTGSGSRLRGAAVGATIGAVSGGDAGAGALAGGAIGGVARRVRNRKAADAQDQAAAYGVQAMQSSYLQARGACLTGRGYSVK